MDWKKLFRDLRKSEEAETRRAKEKAGDREHAKKDIARVTRQRFAPCIEKVSWEFVKTFGWRFGGGYLGPLRNHHITFSLSDETTWVGQRGLDYCEKSITLALDADGSTLEMMGTCITGTRAKDNREVRCTGVYTLPAERLNEEELAKIMVEIYREIEAIRRMYFAEYTDYAKRHNVSAR
jgi:hypothetical protein